MNRLEVPPCKLRVRTDRLGTERETSLRREGLKASDVAPDVDGAPMTDAKGSEIEYVDL